jgi:hypothetical protein
MTSPPWPDLPVRGTETIAALVYANVAVTSVTHVSATCQSEDAGRLFIGFA